MAEEDLDIEKRIERLEEIAETLEAGAVGLETARELREEADTHLETLRDQLDVGDGDVIELDGKDVGVES
jgi:exonuclease VII small subunit